MWIDKKKLSTKLLLIVDVNILLFLNCYLNLSSQCFFPENNSSTLNPLGGIRKWRHAIRGKGGCDCVTQVHKYTGVLQRRQGSQKSSNLRDVIYEWPLMYNILMCNDFHLQHKSCFCFKTQKKPVYEKIYPLAITMYNYYLYNAQYCFRACTQELFRGLNILCFSVESAL